MSEPRHTANSALRTDSAASLPRWLRWLTGAFAIVGLAAATFLSGPRYNMGNPAPTPRALPPANVAELDNWLAKAEGSTPGIRPNNQKVITWHDKLGQKTPWAVVYLHGFSASRLETAPLADEVAKALGANAFHTRFTGHGQDGNALANATPQDWMADTIEAIQIANSLGERVLVISVSTGSTLAAWLGATGRGDGVAGHVFISPNFGPKDKRSELLTGPWGQEIAQAVQGPNRSFVPDAPGIWTSDYPTRALFPMMAMVEYVLSLDLSAFKTPLLLLYSEQDNTVDPVLGKAAFAGIGSTNKTLENITYSKAKGQHVLAGRAKDPDAVGPMVLRIAAWANSLPK